MFLIFYGPMKNGHGAAAIEYTAINLDHFRGRHWRDEQLRRQDQSRAEQRRGDKRVGGERPAANDRDALAKLGGVSDCGAGVVHAEALVSNRPAMASLFWWGASLLHFRGKL